MSPALIGYQVGLVYASAAITAVLGGGLVRRFGSVRTSQLSLALAAAGCALSAVGTFTLLVIGAIVIGLGYGATIPRPRSSSRACPRVA